MDSSITFEVQSALYARLTEALSVTVYDSVPHDAPYPYVTIDDENTTNADFLNSRFETLFQTLTIWSSYQGQKEARELIDQIHAAVHRTRLDIEAGRAFEVLVTRHRVTRDVDEMTYMGQMTLQIRLQR